MARCTLPELSRRWGAADGMAHTTAVERRRRDDIPHERIGGVRRDANKVDEICPRGVVQLGGVPDAVSAASST